MKNYFENDYKGRDDRDIKVFLKRKYDEADEIFDRRFSEEGNNFSGKIAELQGKIQAVKDRIEAENYQYDGLASLTLGIYIFAWLNAEMKSFYQLMVIIELQCHILEKELHLITLMMYIVKLICY